METGKDFAKCRFPGNNLLDSPIGTGLGFNRQAGFAHVGLVFWLALSMLVVFFGSTCGPRGRSLLDRDVQTSFHEGRLLAVNNDLGDSGEQESNRSSSDDQIREFDAIKNRRGIMYLGSIPVGFGISLGGVYFWCNRRRYLGWLVGGLGFFLIGGCLLLLVSSGNPRTWGWGL